MKTEYILTVAERDELARIDMAIAQLYKQKAEIYMRANCRYILETPEEIEAAKNYDRFRSYGFGLPVISKEGIVKIVTDANEDTRGMRAGSKAGEQ